MALLTFCDYPVVAFEFDSDANADDYTLDAAIQSVPRQGSDPATVRFSKALKKGVKVIKKRNSTRWYTLSLFMGMILILTRDFQVTKIKLLLINSSINLDFISA